MSNDSTRTRIWFPLFSYFESSVDGIIPNEYSSLSEIFLSMICWVIGLKGACMLTARRIWLNQQRSETSSAKKRHRRSQSQTPSRKTNDNKLTVNGTGDTADKLRRSMDSLNNSNEFSSLINRKIINTELKQKDI